MRWVVSGLVCVLVGIILLAAWLLSGCGCAPSAEVAPPAPQKPQEGNPPTLPYNVTGKVMTQSQEGIYGATVTALKDTTEVDATLSDAKGNYFLWLESGTYTVKADKSGYQSAQKSVNIPTTGEVVTVPDLVLTSVP